MPHLLNHALFLMNRFVYTNLLIRMSLYMLFRYYIVCHKVLYRLSAFVELFLRHFAVVIEVEARCLLLQSRQRWTNFRRSHSLIFARTGLSVLTQTICNPSVARA